MKSMVKFLGIIAIAAIIGFAFVACDTGTGTANGRGSEQTPPPPPINPPANGGGQNQSTVTSVTVSPPEPTVQVGTEFPFSASVSVTGNPPRDVTWTVTGGGSGGTSIGATTGLLTVAADETATTLTVRAASTHDTTVYGTTTVTVSQTEVLPPENINPPTGLTAAVGQMLSDVGLPVYWSWVDENALLGAAGRWGHFAYYSRPGYLPIRIWLTVDVTAPVTTVTEVTVSPNPATVNRGGTKTFTATVDGTNNPPQEVIWTVEGGSTGTSIDYTTGVLTVAADETAASLTVGARSTFNAFVSGTAAVTVTVLPPTVIGVTVSPNPAVVIRGAIHTFTATVTGDNNPPQYVTWTVEGGGVGTSINATTGFLTVAADETSNLTVRATSTFNTAVSGTAAVTVPQPAVTVSPSTAVVNRGGTETFTASVTGIGIGNPPQTVTWTVEGGGAGTSINASGLLTVASNEPASSLTVRAASTFNTAVSGTAAVTIPPTITSVTVSPSTAVLNRGGTETFTATVIGIGNPTQTVTWTVEGGGAGTSINASGLLTVASNEPASSLTVRATSTFNTAVSGMVAVGVLQPNPLPIDMVRINPGSVTPIGGSTITITAGFYIGRHQVTQHQWQEVMAGNNNYISATPSWFRAGGNGAAQVTGQDTANFPVESVSLFEILVFINRLSEQRGRTPVYSIGGSTDPDDWGPVPTHNFSPNIAAWNAVTIEPGNGYRLPTSTQWEFAARAKEPTDFHNGVDWVSEAITAPLVAPIAWIWHNSGNRTHHVGTRAANAWGLHDMHGNVWEWCWGDTPGGHLLHGGSWNSYASHARASNQWNFNIPHNRWYGRGFRLVRPAN